MRKWLRWVKRAGGVLVWLFAAVHLAGAQGSYFGVRFYGTGTGQTDRIKIPLASAPAMNVGDDFTIEFWLRAAYADNAGVVYAGMNGDGWITGNVILDRDVYGGGDYGDYGIALGRQGGACVIAFGAHNGAWGETIVGTRNVGDDRWHHVAVLRAATGAMRIFIDGAPDASGMGPAGDISYRMGRPTGWPASDPYLVIGAEKHDAGSPYPSFAGGFDELRIWARVLTPAEIAATARTLLPPMEQAGLAACWRLEEGAGTAVRDSANGFTGSLFTAGAGYGEWTAWTDDTNAVAPIAADAPRLRLVRTVDDAAILSWFGAWHVRHAVESHAADGAWTPVAGATNLAATDAMISVTLAPLVPSRLYRVTAVGAP